MLISITGSSGSGKSTIINHLKEMGFDTIQRKTSRSILSDWNVTLDQVNSDFDLTVRFQNEILLRKFNDDYIAYNSSHTMNKVQVTDKIYITERSFADLFVYALSVLGHQNNYNDWLNSYYIKCCQYQSIYDRIIMLPSNKFQTEKDGTRPANMHFNNMIDMTMKHYIPKMGENLFTVVEELSVQDRLRTITNRILNDQMHVSDRFWLRQNQCELYINSI